MPSPLLSAPTNSPLVQIDCIKGQKPPRVRSLRSAPFTTCISSGEPSVRYRSLPALVVRLKCARHARSSTSRWSYAFVLTHILHKQERLPSSLTHILYARQQPRYRSSSPVGSPGNSRSHRSLCSPPALVVAYLALALLATYLKPP